MNIVVSFVEYEAVNNLQGLSPTAFTLVSTAKLGKIGNNNRTWLLEGGNDAFGALRHDIDVALSRFQRTSVAASLSDVAKLIHGAMEG